MRTKLIFLTLVTIFLSCNVSSDKEQTIDKKDNNLFEIYLDTLNQIESSSLKLDSSSFSTFFDTKDSYNLIYHESGKVTNGENQYAISAYSINDTTIQVKLLKNETARWRVCDTVNLFDIKFSPAMFSPSYADFNQDGVNDLLLVFAQSMGVAYGYGYLILINKDNETLLSLIHI